jgi:hypothetical protein
VVEPTYTADAIAVAETLVPESRPGIDGIRRAVATLTWLEDQMVDFARGYFEPPFDGYRDWLIKGIQVHSVVLANEGRRFAEQVDRTGWAWQHSIKPDTEEGKESPDGTGND